MEAVFGNILLLETILTYVINNERSNICSANLCSVRLVQKLWLETASKLVQKSTQCASVIYLNKENSLIGTEYVKKFGKLLDGLKSTILSKNHLQISVLPVNISMEHEFFHAENYHSMLTYFIQCGKHLKWLNIEFPADGGSMPVTFPLFSLPNLQYLYVYFLNKNSVQEITDKVYGDNRNGLSLLQAILNASPNMKSLIFVSESETLATNFDYLKLPETVTTIFMDVPFSSTIRDFFLQNELPVLQKLELPADSEAREDGIASISSVLEHFRRSLKSITLSGCDDSVVRLPLMESLETLDLYGSPVNLEFSSSCIQTLMPKLKKICAQGQAESWITKISNLGVFTTVEEIDFKCFMFPMKTTQVDFAMMKRLHSALPFLIRLNIFVAESDMSALKYVFAEMKQLQSLEIRFNCNEEDITADPINSALMGFPNEAKQLNLLNLSVLQKLHLLSLDNLEDDGSSLLTEVLFQNCLQKMGNLKVLLLSGKFKPTIEMQTAWRNQGRFMEYREIVGPLNPFEQQVLIML